MACVKTKEMALYYCHRVICMWNQHAYDFVMENICYESPPLSSFVNMTFF